MNNHRRIVQLGSVLVLSTFVLGCANNSEVRRVAVPAYESDLTRARASVAEAEQSGAAEFGNAQLSLAREKLREAEAFADDGDFERARRLALEADLDADLAVAITRNRETQQLVTEVRSGLQTLEDELRRGATTDPAVP